MAKGAREIAVGLLRGREAFAQMTEAKRIQQEGWQDIGAGLEQVENTGFK
jgi:hypothetical protein